MSCVNFFNPRFLLNENNSCPVGLYKNHRLGLVEVEDRRSGFNKIYDVLRALGNHFKTIVDRCGRRISTREIPAPSSVNGKTFTYAPAVCPWNTAKKSDGLYLLVHGLRGSATDWDRYVEEIQACDPGAHVFAPAVALRGNCALKTAADPLLEVVKSYLKKYPGKPVTLIGTSNGARIIKYIETYLRPSLVGQSRLSVVSIAGVHYGSQRVPQLKSSGLLPILRFEQSFEREIDFANSLAKKDLTAWKDKQRIWQRNHVSVRHFFGATTEDESVRSLASSLPYCKGANSVYQVINGHSHVSVVDAMRQDVMNWLK